MSDAVVDGVGDPLELGSLDVADGVLGVEDGLGASWGGVASGSTAVIIVNPVDVLCGCSLVISALADGPGASVSSGVGRLGSWALGDWGWGVVHWLPWLLGGLGGLSGGGGRGRDSRFACGGGDHGGRGCGGGRSWDRRLSSSGKSCGGCSSSCCSSCSCSCSSGG